jgi:hypothetical protein
MDSTVDAGEWRVIDRHVCGTDWVAYLGPGGLQSVEMIIAVVVTSRWPSVGQVVTQRPQQQVVWAKGGGACFV